jgi:hypothetical protein
MLVVQGAGTAWAWSGAHLGPAVGIDATRAYSDVPESLRWDDARRAEAAWLTAQSGGWQALGTRPVFALRYLNSRGDGLLDTHLLWRAEGSDAALAAAAAVSIGERLAIVPRHIQAVPMTGEAEVTAALRPFDPHATGVAEIRKRLTAARCTRSDTGRGVCVAVTPFGTETRSWEPLWAALAAARFPAMVTITLAPYQADPRLTAGMAGLADEYRRLASAGPSATAIYDRPLVADLFAARAAPLYADAARRYSGDVYAACVTLAAAQPLPPLLAETFAGLVALPGQAPPAVVRPAAEEMAAMWGNISMLNLDPLEIAALQGIPSGALGPLERVLGGIVDVAEAATLFRMPYTVPGHLPLFRGLPVAVSAPVHAEPPGSAPEPSAPGRDPWLSRFKPGGRS